MISNQGIQSLGIFFAFQQRKSELTKNLLLEPSITFEISKINGYKN